MSDWFDDLVESAYQEVRQRVAEAAGELLVKGGRALSDRYTPGAWQAADAILGAITDRGLEARIKGGSTEIIAGERKLLFDGTERGLLAIRPVISQATATMTLTRDLVEEARWDAVSRAIGLGPEETQTINGWVRYLLRRAGIPANDFNLQRARRLWRART